jgi:hypothetical protein
VNVLGKQGRVEMRVPTVFGVRCLIGFPSEAVSHNLSFEYANNPQPGPSSSGSMNVLVTGSTTLLSQNVTHSGSTFSNMRYQLFFQDFTADSATTTLQFEALTNSGFGIALDAVSVNPATTAVPEPALMGPLGAGLVALLFAARCRRRTSHATRYRVGRAL